MRQFFCGHCHWRVVLFDSFIKYIGDVQVCQTCLDRNQTEYEAHLYREFIKENAVVWQPVREFPTHEQLRESNERMAE